MPVTRAGWSVPGAGVHVERDGWLRRIEQLDPAVDVRETHEITTSYESPGDMDRALSSALYRTYAVPSIGASLDRTAALTERAQERYEDTRCCSGRCGSTGSPARRAAVAMLELRTTFPPGHLLPAGLVTRAAYAPLDEPLLDAFGGPVPRTPA